MKRSVRLVIALMAVLFCLSAALDAAEEGKRRQKQRQKKPQRMLRGSYGAIAKEVKLDESQMKRMAKALKAKSEAVRAWQKDPAKGGALAALAKELKSPDVKGNRAKVKEIRAKMKPLQAERRALEAKLEAAVMAVLTPQQKEAWAVAVLYRQMTGRLRRAKLTAEQQAKIRQLCSAANKKMATLAPTDRKAKAAAARELEKSIRALLTPEQQKLLKARPKPKKKPKAKAEKKGKRTKKWKKKT